MNLNFESFIKYSVKVDLFQKKYLFFICKLNCSLNGLSGYLPDLFSMKISLLYIYISYYQKYKILELLLKLKLKKTKMKSNKVSSNEFAYLLYAYVSISTSVLMGISKITDSLGKALNFSSIASLIIILNMIVFILSLFYKRKHIVHR